MKRASLTLSWIISIRKQNVRGLLDIINLFLDLFNPKKIKMFLLAVVVVYIDR